MSGTAAAKRAFHHHRPNKDEAVIRLRLRYIDLAHKESGIVDVANQLHVRCRSAPPPVKFGNSGAYVSRSGSRAPSEQVLSAPADRQRKSNDRIKEN